MTRQTKRNQRFFRCNNNMHGAEAIILRFVSYTRKNEKNYRIVFLRSLQNNSADNNKQRIKNRHVSKRREQEKIQVLHVTPIMVFSSFVRFSFDCGSWITRLTHIFGSRQRQRQRQHNTINNSGFILIEKNTTDKMPLIHFVWLKKRACVSVCVCVFFLTQ